MEKEKKSVLPIPKGFHTVTPFLIVDDANALIKFMKKAFHAEVTYLMQSDEGMVIHATVKIGDSMIMLSNSNERFKSMPCMLHLYVEDMDTVYNQAIKAGGISLREPRNEFYGDRSGGIQDSWGNQWWIATHIEDVSDEEIQIREEELRKKQGMN